MAGSYYVCCALWAVYAVYAVYGVYAEYTVYAVYAWRECCSGDQTERGLGGLGLTDRAIAVGWSFPDPAAAARGCGRGSGLWGRSQSYRSQLSNLLLRGPGWLDLVEISLSRPSKGVGGTGERHKFDS